MWCDLHWNKFLQHSFDIDSISFQASVFSWTVQTNLYTDNSLLQLYQKWFQPLLWPLRITAKGILMECNGTFHTHRVEHTNTWTNQYGEIPVHTRNLYNSASIYYSSSTTQQLFLLCWDLVVHISGTPHSGCLIAQNCIDFEAITALFYCKSTSKDRSINGDEVEVFNWRLLYWDGLPQAVLLPFLVQSLCTEVSKLNM